MNATPLQWDDSFLIGIDELDFEHRRLIDDLNRMILDELLPRFGLAYLDEPQRAHLNKVWHRLDPWPDAVAGLP